MVSQGRNKGQVEFKNNDLKLSSHQDKQNVDFEYSRHPSR